MNIFFLLVVAFSVCKLLISVTRHPFCPKMITFSSYGIIYRHHIYEKHGGPKSLELKEIGPRFEMRLYQVSIITISSIFTAPVISCLQVRNGSRDILILFGRGRKTVDIRNEIDVNWLFLDN